MLYSLPFYTDLLIPLYVWVSIAATGVNMGINKIVVVEKAKHVRVLSINMKNCGLDF